MVNKPQKSKFIRDPEEVAFINELNSTFNPSIKLHELQVNQEYKITKFRQVSSKYGSFSIATIIINNNKFDVFLPKRFSIPSWKINNCYIVYQGLAQDNKGRFEFHDLQFYTK